LIANRWQDEEQEERVTLNLTHSAGDVNADFTLRSLVVATAKGTALGTAGFQFLHALQLMLLLVQVVPPAQA
jgi:hypothetical protein